MLGLFKKRVKKPRKIYIIIDGERKEYVLVDDKYIPRDKIISIDPTSKKIVYIDYDGKLRVASLPGDQVKEENQVKIERGPEMYI